MCKCIYVILYVRINTRAYGVRVGLNAICGIIVTLAARRHYVLHIHVYIASTIVRCFPWPGLRVRSIFLPALSPRLAMAVVPAS